MQNVFIESNTVQEFTFFRKLEGLLAKMQNVA
jgi:hypothetical protein